MVSMNPQRMRKLVVVAALLGSFSVLAKVPQHAEAKELMSSPKLRQNMTLMEGRYLNLQILTKSNGIDYDQILKAIDQMEAHAQKIRQINTNEILDQPLVELDAQIAKLKKYAVSQNPIKLRRGIDSLYSTCFRCHAAHAPSQQ